MFQEEDCGPPPPPEAKGEKGSLPKGSLPFCAEEEEEDWEKAAAAKGSLLAELAEGEENGSLGAEDEAKVVREKGSPPPRPDRGAGSAEGVVVAVVAAAPADSSVPNAAATGAVNGSSLSWNGSPAAAAMSKGSP